MTSKDTVPLGLLILPMEKQATDVSHENLGASIVSVPETFAMQPKKYREAYGPAKRTQKHTFCRNIAVPCASRRGRCKRRADSTCPDESLANSLGANGYEAMSTSASG